MLRKGERKAKGERTSLARERETISLQFFNDLAMNSASLIVANTLYIVKLLG